MNAGYDGVYCLSYHTIDKELLNHAGFIFITSVMGIETSLNIQKRSLIKNHNNVFKKYIN